MDKNTHKVKLRCLKVVEENFVTLTKESSRPSRSKLHEPQEENFAENNTKNITINNTLNNISSSASDLAGRDAHKKKQ